MKKNSVVQIIEKKQLVFEIISLKERNVLGSPPFFQKAKNRYLIPEIKVINFSSQPVMIKPEMFHLQDDLGNIYNVDDIAYAAVGLETMLIHNFDIEIPERIPVTGYLPFDVPKNSNIIKLIVNFPGIEPQYELNLQESTPHDTWGVLNSSEEVSQ